MASRGGSNPVLDAGLRAHKSGRLDEAARLYRRVLALDAKAEGRRIAILSGGETTVTVTGTGRGGRNQEYLLGFALGTEGAKEAPGARLTAIISFPPFHGLLLEDQTPATSRMMAKIIAVVRAVSSSDTASRSNTGLAPG